MIPVLIVGAGPTGLALALWLTRVGVAVRIIDKNSGPADYSRALGVQARTLELYQMLGIAQHVIEVPETPELLSPVVVTVPLQLLAYHVARLRDCDVDQPRNLAKSVTVE